MATPSVKPREFSLELELTYMCNLRCMHCYLGKLLDENPISMPLSMAKDIIKQYAENDKILRYVNCKRLILSGGEPLTYPNFKEIYEYAIEQSNIEIYITTNALLIPKYIGIFKENTIFQVSLDGTREHHDWLRGRGTYDKALNSIKMLKEHGFEVIIKTTLHRYNKDDWIHIVNLVNKLNLDGYSFNFYIKTKYNEPVGLELSPEEIYKLVKIITPITIFTKGFSLPYMWSRCYAGIFHITVTPDGRYIDCPIPENYLGRYPQRLDEVIDYGTMAEGIGRITPCILLIYFYNRDVEKNIVGVRHHED